jgi:hypothetical protein
MRSFFPIVLVIAGLTSFAQAILQVDKDGKMIPRDYGNIDLATYTGEWIIQLNDESKFNSVEAKVKAANGKVVRELKSPKRAGEANKDAEVIIGLLDSYSQNTFNILQKLKKLVPGR